MGDRFDNVSTEELLKREAETRREFEELKKAVAARLIAECPAKIGKVYRTKRLGRWLLVMYIKAVYEEWRREPCYAVKVEGPMKRPRPSPIRNGYHGGVYTSMCHTVYVDSLDLTTERDPP